VPGIRGLSRQGFEPALESRTLLINLRLTRRATRLRGCAPDPGANPQADSSRRRAEGRCGKGTANDGDEDAGKKGQSAGSKGAALGDSTRRVAGH